MLVLLFRMSLNKDKEGVHPTNSTVSLFSKILRDISAHQLTPIEADVLFCGYALKVFTMRQVSVYTIASYKNINTQLERLVSLGFITLQGKRQSGRRFAKVYSITDAGCALVARLSALCR